MFIEDKEIDFVDSEDLLGSSQYVDELSYILKNIPTDNTFTIGLFGKWGTGKSSIIKTIQNKLIDNPKIKFIYFDAWRYKGDSFKRTFLQKVAQSLEIKRSKILDRFYFNTNIKEKQPILLYSLLVLSLLIVIILISKGTIPLPDWLSVILLPCIGFILGIANTLLPYFSNSKNAPLVFASEQFHECFDEIICNFLKDNTPKSKKTVWIKKQKRLLRQRNNQNSEKFDKIIIAIDNLDRSTDATEILYDIKNFMGSYKNLIFIIPIDHTQICTKDNYSKELEKLRKVFNIEIRIRNYEDGELFDFARHLNTKYSLGFSDEVLGIVSDRYAKNPRRIIHCFNNLSAEIELDKTRLTTDEIAKYQTIICKNLIIKEEFPELYAYILNDYELLLSTSIPNEIKLFPEERRKDLENFIKYTNGLCPKADNIILQKIISNRKTYDGINGDINTAIKYDDWQTLKPYIEKDVENIIINKMINNFNNYTFKNAFLPASKQLETLLSINSNIKKLSVRNINKLNTNNFKDILKIIPENKFDSLVHLISDYEKYNDKFSTALYEFIKEDTSTKSDKYFVSLLNETNCVDLIKRDSSLFYKKYVTQKTFSDLTNIDNLEKIYSKDLFIFLANKMQSVKDVFYKNCFLLLQKTPNITPDILAHFINAIQNRIPFYKKAELKTYIETLNDFITLFNKYDFQQININLMLTKIFQYTTFEYIIEDAEDKDTETIKSFLYTLCQAYNNNVRLENLIKVSPNNIKTNTLFINVLTKLLKNNYDISKYFNLMSKINNISSDYLDLINAMLKNTQNLAYIDSISQHIIQNAKPKTLKNWIKQNTDTSSLYRTIKTLQKQTKKSQIKPTPVKN